MKNRIPTLAVLAVASALVLTGCGAAEEPAGTGTGTTGVPSQAAIDEATSVVQPLLEGPTEFAFTEPLESLPTGARVAIIDCGTPICALMADLTEEPAALLGMSLTRIQAGTTADSVAAAFDTIIADGYDGVFVPALPFQLWERSFEQLRAAGIAVSTNGVLGMPEDFEADLAGEQWSLPVGGWLGDWVVSPGPAAAETVIYRTPELAFTDVIVDAYRDRVAALCAQCVVRTVDIPASAIGSTAAAMIVDDLTAHPETTFAVLSIGEQATGLPTALDVAGITTPITMYGAGPAQAIDIQNGDLHSALAIDTPALVWMFVDSGARQIVDQELSVGAVEDAMIAQIITAGNLSGDLSLGWVGYPDIADRFAELWGVK